jgi:lipoate-protein ligase A
MPAESSASGVLRILDFGTTSPLRSQTVWHAIAKGVSDGSPATLSFVRPRDPYVCIGYHRRLSEVDTDFCAEQGWPVFRRMVGGGPVYLDSGQLFFQITLPMSSVPASRPKALRWLLEPAAAAFRASGIDAHLDDRLEIVVRDQKVCGYGAGQIGDAAIVVGNLMETFDHQAATNILRAPTKHARAELSSLMKRYVAPTPTNPDMFRDAAVDRYASALELEPVVGSLSEFEEAQLAKIDARFRDPSWVNGPERQATAAWQVKIRAGVWVFAAERNGTSLTLGVNGDQVVSAAIVDPKLNGAAGPLARSLVGLSLEEAGAALAVSGPSGTRLTELLDLAEPTRL